MMRFLLLFFAFFSLSCSHSKPFGPKPDPSSHDSLVLIGTNDFHGYLRPFETDLEGERVVAGGAEWFAGYMRILEKKFGNRLILLDGGDLFQGTLESNTFFGEPVIEFYNQLPYKAAAVGNHEFDYGPVRKGAKDRLGVIKQRMKEANFPFVQANTYWKRSGGLWREKNLYPSILIEAGGYKVGIIGLTTTDTPATTLPQNVEQLEFRDFLEPTLREVKSLRKKGAEIILIATHEGGEKEGGPIHQLLHALPHGSVDAVVSGHAHQEVHEFVNGVPVIQSKTRGLYFGRIDLYVNRATRRVDPAFTKIHEMHPICGTWFRQEESCDARVAKDQLALGRENSSKLFPLRIPSYEGEVVKPDLKVRGLLEPYFAKAKKMKREALGRAQRDFAWMPSGESEVGALFLEAFRWKFPYAKVIYLNGGGFRRPIFKGEITYGDLYEVHPFDNYGVAVKVNGKQLRELMEIGVSGGHSIPAVSGVRVEYSDSDDPAFRRDLNGDGKKENWERNRLKSLRWENGTSVKEKESFWLATNDYLVSGGDHADRIFSSIPRGKKRFLDLSQRDIAAEYLRAHPGISLPPKVDMKIKANRE